MPRSLHVLVVAATCSALSSLACAKLPQGRTAIDDVSVRGADKVSEGDVLDQIATAPSPKFLGLFRGVVYDYEVFDVYTLQRDLARVERLYRAKGYYDAHARAGRFLPTSDGHVRVEIVVEEGEPTLVEAVVLGGIDRLPEECADAARNAATRAMRLGRPFDEARFDEGKRQITRALTDRGYAWAKVESDATLDVVHHVARVTYAIDAGPIATFGPVTFTGLETPAGGKLPEDQLRGTLDIETGAPYSTKAIDDGTQALLDLGVFASVSVTPELGSGPADPPVVPVAVKVEPGRLREVRFGGGIELDQIKTDLHGLAAWRHRNFLGGLRDLSVEARPGVVLYPTRINQIVAPDRYLPEERVSVQLRQLGFVESRTTGFLRPELNTFPLLVKTDPKPEDPVIGYVEARNTAGVERSFGPLAVSVAHDLQVEFPFAYKDPFDAALRRLVISYPDIQTTLDLRDDRIHTRKGFLLGNDLQIAGFFGDAVDLKIQPEARGYLPIGRRLVFASRASVGLLFPSNYGDVVKNHLAEDLTDANRADRTRDIEIVYFRGFFSGGASSNRGYPLRGIAPHGVVPFLNPATASQQVALQCDGPNPPAATCAIPIGGFTLWELSNELRIAITKLFSTAVFCDMSDVSNEIGDVRLGHLHLSCGAGARYDTLVGPIRLDVGYRIQPLQVIGYASEQAKQDDDVANHRPTDGVQPTIFGVPLAIAIGIGEAF